MTESDHPTLMNSLSPAGLLSPSGPLGLERRAVTFKNQKRVLCKQDQVVLWLQEFYTIPGNLEKLLSILQGNSEISLRLVDYFVTNYAKKMNTSFTKENRHFLVYFNYKRELNAYSKRLFDPFCRRERILFQMKDIPAFVTTVGKLNFFRWAIEKGVIDYIKMNLSTIEKQMNESARELQKIRKQEKKSLVADGKRVTRRKVLSTDNVSTKQMQKHFTPIEISFE